MQTEEIHIEERKIKLLYKINSLAFSQNTKESLENN